MRKKCTVGLFVLLMTGVLFGQSPAKVDFRRDVQPLFKQYCVGCHGPSLQMNGFRLDRRSDAMRGGTIPVIGAGNSAGSRLYQRLIGSDYGIQMPPTGALSPQQIKIIKDWIDQGAEWPDDVSGETPPTPPDPAAVRMMDAIRKGDTISFRKILHENPRAVNLKGLGGSTPLMYAVLYGQANDVRALLEAGANPNIPNDAGATALMWAVDNINKTRLLLDHGADVNAKSDGNRTPLMIATSLFGSGPVVKLLLDHGANPSVKAPGLFGDETPISGAAYAGDAGVLQMLIDKGADVKTAGPISLAFAIRANCTACINLLLKSASPEVVTGAMFFSAPPLGDARAVNVLLDHGANINARGPGGLTLLMLAASSDALPVDIIKTLIARGADVNAKSAAGLTALDFAMQHGKTSVVEVLEKAGAQGSGARTASTAKATPAESIRVALQRSMPLLQRTDAAFIPKTGCVSCHNDTLTAMSVATARQGGFRVDDQIAHKQVATIAKYLDSWRERVLQGVGIPGDSDTVSYILIGMAAEHYPPDIATDAMAHYLKSRQLPNGEWMILAHRPPLESSNFEVTAASMHALQAYAPVANRTEYAKAVHKAADWLEKTQPQSIEDRSFQLLGMGWAGSDRAKIKDEGQKLLALQRSDGGWSQIPSLESDAYATGQALVALRESGAVATNDPAFQRGIRFLLRTQYQDGSWSVKSRAIPIQPYFESGFPNGRDQFISATGTNWASMALALAAPQGPDVAASGGRP
ncbi:MAG: ankyrin repeat domain-containing protein [Acidobacteriia bacterium]|nr:ankyrin repeat domain-containing protein [Terriglobia bacterium]